MFLNLLGTASFMVLMNRVMFTLLWALLCQFKRIDAAIKHVDSRCIGTYFNYTRNSIYEQNLNLVLSNLPSQASDVKFYNSTVGVGPNKVYGLFQCRQDLSLNVCSQCIQEASQRIVKDCTLFGEALVWYYECMLRYSNRKIFSLSEISPSSILFNASKVPDNAMFSEVLSTTMDSVITAAAASSPSGHFATKEANLSFSNKLYTLAQCTPDIVSFDCNNCLGSALIEIDSECPTGCFSVISFYPSCQLWYDTTPFYNVTPPAPPPSKQPSNKRLKPGIIVGIVVAVSVGILLSFAVTWLCLHQRKAKEPLLVPEEAPKGSRDMKRDEVGSLGDSEFEQYDFGILEAATGGFLAKNKLGQGGFGTVYKGVLKTGKVVAIKRLSGNSAQGEQDFMTEASIVAKLQHKNLVKLIGYCSENDEKLLVYEFMPNTSLDKLLFDPRKREILEWDIRSKIIMGVARGLQYLHEDSRLTIIHRDLKTNNILLDEDLNPKIADFGIAKPFAKQQHLGKTRRIAGTLGYMAPEYILTGEYSNKSDVYSFGIIALEIVSGQRNRMPEREDLPIYTWRLWKADRSLELMDPLLLNKCSTNEVMKCIQIGLLCVQRNPVDRPTMGRIVLMLTGTIALPTPSSPLLPSDDLGDHIYNTDHDVAGSQGTLNNFAQPRTNSVIMNTTNFEQDLYPQ